MYSNDFFNINCKMNAISNEIISPKENISTAFSIFTSVFERIITFFILYLRDFVRSGSFQISLILFDSAKDS